MASPSVSRILYLSSPAVLDSTGDDHPSWRGVAAPLMRLPGTWPTGSRRPCLPCSGWGLPSRHDCSSRWWSLTPPFHPCLCNRLRQAILVQPGWPDFIRRHRRFTFCCTFRRVAPPGSYPAPCPVESGLSSIFRLRSSDRLAQPV